ncbi:MAG: hypothetical protein ACXVXP_00175 [Mycobacteriaceae bacterium]
MKWNYLRLLGALLLLGVAATSVYTERGEPTWGFVGCAAFIVAAMLNLEDHR